MCEQSNLRQIIPSKYQEDIYNFIENGKGNLVVEASAGAAKTFTAIHSLRLIPTSKKVLFCGFNTDIVNEIKEKVGKKSNVDIRTIHSLGYMILKRYFRGNVSLQDMKYRTYIYNNLKELSSFKTSSLKRSDFLRYSDNIFELVNFLRYNLFDTEDGGYELVERHGLNLIQDEVKVALKVLEWGKTHTEEVDFTDMVWLPNVLDIKTANIQYDFIYVDESQDMSIAQKELVLRCQREGTRFVFIGDSAQSIYSFASASPEAFKKLKELPNTTSLPLPISYRCPKKIVDFARQIEPSIEANDTADDGEIIMDSNLQDINVGDMVLCRNNAPLMKAYTDFIRMGKTAYIRGKDIGINLEKMVKSANQLYINANLKNDGVFVRLYESLFNDIRRCIVDFGFEAKRALTLPQIINKLDMINALEALSEGINNTEELLLRIRRIFTDSNNDKDKAIYLSTIHKAKGLEADNVFIICDSLMPSKYAYKDWEIEQERNLQYVAYTRAKKKLCFVKEDYFKDFMDIDIADKLRLIEAKVYKITGNPIKVENKSDSDDSLKKHDTFVYPKKSDDKTMKPTKMFRREKKRNINNYKF